MHCTIMSDADERFTANRRNGNGLEEQGNIYIYVFFFCETEELYFYVFPTTAERCRTGKVGCLQRILKTYT